MVTDNPRTEHDATKAGDNPLWIYAVRQYREEGCAQFLLEAQDEMGLEINILLFSGWLASCGKSLEFASVARSRALAWQYDIIEPLREVRRRAQDYQQPEFYRQTLALELDAEQQQLRILYDISEQMPKGHENFSHSVRLSCERYFKEKNTPLEESWLQTLIKHLQPNGRA